MSGNGNSMQDALEPTRCVAFEGEHDWETMLHELALDGNVDALAALREELAPIDYDELGWAD